MIYIICSNQDSWKKNKKEKEKEKEKEKVMINFVGVSLYVHSGNVQNSHLDAHIEALL